MASSQGPLMLLFLCTISDQPQRACATTEFDLLPMVINTWPFQNATNRAYETLVRERGDVLQGIVRGCQVCEEEQCDFTVGFGGSPDTNGETTLDAMIMDGTTRNVGAVAYLRRIKNAIGVARAVLEHSSHSILAGEGARDFAKMMGFREVRTLSTAYSQEVFQNWTRRQCQPNYYLDVAGQDRQCPPYTPLQQKNATKKKKLKTRLVHNPHQSIDFQNHDTIGMVAINSLGHVAAGTSTNGANHKIAGRVGDAPIPGAGAYCDDQVGGAAATGDGDIMMRFLPSFQAVQFMKRGMTPTEACATAMREIISFYPNFKGGLICVNIRGQHGAAGYGWIFSYSVRSPAFATAQVIHVPPLVLNTALE